MLSASSARTTRIASVPNDQPPTIETAKLLLDSHFRLLEVSDAGRLLANCELPAGGDLREYWPGLRSWLRDYQAADSGDFSACLPGVRAHLSTLGDQYRLLHLWRPFDALKSLLSMAQFNILVFAEDRSLVFVNDTAAQLHQQIPFEDWSQILPEEMKAQFPEWLTSERPLDREREFNGHYLRWEISPDPDHRFLILTCLPMHDRENYRRILEYSVDGIYQTSRAGELVYANNSLATLFGYATPAEMRHHIRQVDRDIYRYPQDRRRFVEWLKQETEVTNFECEMMRKDGRVIWVRQNARSVSDDTGALDQIIGTVADITQLKRAEQDKRRAESSFRRLFNNAQAGLYQSTGDGRFLRVNDMFARLLGFDTPRECIEYYADIGRDLWVDRRQRESLLRSLSRQQRITNLRVQLKRRDGEIIWVLLNSQYVHDSNSDTVVLEGSIFDITDQIRAESDIRFLAEHDPLTQLPNRSRFQHRMDELYEHWRRHRFHEFVVIFLDLDHFKDINDTLGHMVGDALLQEIANRLNQPLNTTYQTFRLGGDEFAIVIDGDLSETELDTLCQQVCKRVGREYVHQENRLKVTASLGVVRSSQLELENAERPLEDIMRAADLALYSCKRTGRAGYRLYHESMRLQLQSEKELEKRLADAIDNDELRLHFQPVFSTRTGRIIGAEALIRWPTPEGMISPVQFIPLAERCGLIADIDAWVLEQMLGHCERLAAYQPDIRLSFNLSAHHFNFDTFADLIAPLEGRIKRWGGNLALELTERVMFENTAKVIQSLNELRRYGVTISLDDFGTGYSSLSYLTQFPVDKIKIDQSFIRDMLDNTTAMAVVQAAAQIGKTLKLEINAEGVETEAQHRFIRNLDIDEVQGFYLGRPMPLEDLLARLA